MLFQNLKMLEQEVEKERWSDDLLKVFFWIKHWLLKLNPQKRLQSKWSDSQTLKKPTREYNRERREYQKETIPKCKLIFAAAILRHFDIVSAFFS